MGTPPRGRFQATSPEPRASNAATARLATRIRELITLGKFDIELIDAIADEFPRLSLRSYAHALAGYRAEVGAPRYPFKPRVLQ